MFFCPWLPRVYIYVELEASLYDIITVADPGFQKGGTGAIMGHSQNNGFWTEYCIRKS